jgi:hypothetical protein
MVYGDTCGKCGNHCDKNFSAVFHRSYSYQKPWMEPMNVVNNSSSSYLD